MIWLILAFLAPSIIFVAIRAYVTRNDRPDDDMSWPGKPLRYLELDASQWERIP